LKLWNFKNGDCVKTFEGHTDGVNSVSFSQDDKLVISGSEDETLKLWNFQTGKSVKALQGHTEPVLSVSFSKDDKFVVSGS
jgi:WD40 repeat protein